MRWYVSACVFIAALLSFAPTARAVDMNPGDSCAGFAAGSYRPTGGPENPSGALVVCDGSIWQPILRYSSVGSAVMFASTGLPTAPLHVWGEAIIGNQGLACDSATEGALRYDSAGTALALCDGSAWGAIGSGTVGDYQIFTSSGTWTKPSGVADNQLVIVEMWGGGGGGTSAGSGGGGGGGAYKKLELRVGDLGATVAVTVGTGGAAGNSGGDSSFGAHGAAYGGANGTSGAFYRGGRGGGQVSAGNAGGHPFSSAQSIFGGGVGGDGSDGGASIYGGGGGGAGTNPPYDGGDSVYGGGGGGGKYIVSTGTGGISVDGGGNGGDATMDGAIPGGGGGAGGGSGARGEVRVWVVGGN